MPPTPPSTTSSSTGHSPDGAQFRVVRKRNRVPLSCGPCRHRKLKCNRAHPCDNCTKRGDVDACTYASPAARKKNQSSHGSSNSPDDMQNRIDRLEGLVLALMTNGAQSAGPTAATAAIAGTASTTSAEPRLDIEDDDMIREESVAGEDSDVEHVVKSLGIMKVDNGRHIFASEAHWYAILGELAEVKAYFAEHKKEYVDHTKKVKANHPEEDKERPGTALLFRTVKPAGKTEILNSFPTKNTADLLIARYFNVYDPSLHVVHGFKYQKEYDKHWIDPNSTPVIWLGLSYAMMCLALQSYTRAGDEPPEYRNRTWEMSNEYRRLTAQCLLLEDISSPIDYMVETLLLHVYAEYARSKDAEPGILIVIGIIVRLAMRMGLHRDAGAFATITPFQGEMRRRVWTAVRQADLLFSSQVGLPPIIRTVDTNAELPRNVYDDELFEDMRTLPSSRPLTEITPTTFMIVKARLINLYGRVVEAVQSIVDTSYEDIMKLDQELREFQAAMPPDFQMRPFEESARDRASVVMERYTLELLILRAQCVLHRKFLGPCRQNSRYAYSRRTCVDASMAVLDIQATLQRETQAGGRLRGVKWFISSLMTNDYLLAAMIIALDLYHTSEAERTGRRSSTDTLEWPKDKRDNMMAALERSRTLWETQRDHSMEAFKAHATLSAISQKVQKNQAMRQAQQTFAVAEDDPNVGPEHSAAMTLGMLSGSLTTNAANMFENPQYSTYNGMPAQTQATGLTSNYANTAAVDHNGVAAVGSPFSQFFGASNFGFQSMDPSGNVDWDAWDSFLQAPGATTDPTNQMFAMNLDIPPTFVDGQPDGQAQQQHYGQNASGVVNGAGGVFMGVSTPPGNVM